MKYLTEGQPTAPQYFPYNVQLNIVCEYSLPPLYDAHTHTHTHTHTRTHISTNTCTVRMCVVQMCGSACVLMSV